MRTTLAAIGLILFAGTALAQTKQESESTPPQLKETDGRTVSPETKGQMQPQGPTGPINTTTGGAPAESPQGQTPPGMQSAPEGSSKTVVEPSK